MPRLGRDGLRIDASRSWGTVSALKKRPGPAEQRLAAVASSPQRGLADEDGACRRMRRAACLHRSCGGRVGRCRPRRDTFPSWRVPDFRGCSPRCPHPLCSRAWRNSSVSHYRRLSPGAFERSCLPSQSGRPVRDHEGPRPTNEVATPSAGRGPGFIWSHPALAACAPRQQASRRLDRPSPRVSSPASYLQLRDLAGCVTLRFPAASRSPPHDPPGTTPPRRTPSLPLERWVSGARLHVLLLRSSAYRFSSSARWMACGAGRGGLSWRSRSRSGSTPLPLIRRLGTAAADATLGAGPAIVWRIIPRWSFSGCGRRRDL